MLLDSKWIIELKKFLMDRGYPNIETDLIVYGGKNNGTVDLKASKENFDESIIIEIMDSPVQLIDLSRYLELKRSIERNKKRNETMKFYLLTCEHTPHNEMTRIAEERGIIIENFEEFIKKKNI